MTINAKYPGRCNACGGPIAVGDRIEWEKGKGSRHAECPRERQSTGTSASSMPRTGGPWAGARGGVRHESGSNRRAGSCERCGEWLPAGAGRLEYCVEDSGCPRHHDESGYHLYCADPAACLARAKAAREEATKVRAARQAAEDGLKAVLALTAQVNTAPAWVAGAAPVAQWTKPAMVHTIAYPVLYLTDTEIYYYVPGYFACDWDYPAEQRGGDITPEQHAQIIEALSAGRAVGILK